MLKILFPILTHPAFRLNKIKYLSVLALTRPNSLGQNYQKGGICYV